MSSDDNVKTVQSVYEAFGRGDIPTVLDAVTDDVDWATEVGSDRRHHGGASAHGKAGVDEFFGQFAAADGGGRVHAAGDRRRR